MTSIRFTQLVKSLPIVLTMLAGPLAHASSSATPLLPTVSSGIYTLAAFKRSDASEIRNLPLGAIAQLAPSTFHRITIDKIAEFLPVHLRLMTREQLRVQPPKFFRALSIRQLLAFTPEQIASFSSATLLEIGQRLSVAGEPFTVADSQALLNYGRALNRTASYLLNLIRVGSIAVDSLDQVQKQAADLMARTVAIVQKARLLKDQAQQGQAMSGRRRQRSDMEPQAAQVQGDAASDHQAHKRQRLRVDIGLIDREVDAARQAQEAYTALAAQAQAAAAAGQAQQDYAPLAEQAPQPAYPAAVQAPVASTLLASPSYDQAVNRWLPDADPYAAAWLADSFLRSTPTADQDGAE